MSTPTLQAQILTAYYESAGLYGPLVLVRMPTAEGEEMRAFSSEEGRLFPTQAQAYQAGRDLVAQLEAVFSVEVAAEGAVTPRAGLLAKVQEFVAELSAEEQEIQDHRRWREEMDRSRRAFEANIRRFDEGMMELEASLAQTEEAR